MASPHAPYVSPGGAYYPTQSPPPPSPYNYGPSHAGPSSYPYQYPMPPQHVVPNPPRITTRGGYRPRGGHHAYQNYAHQQQQQFMPGPMPLPPNGSAAKFSPPHPSYAYPHAGPYSPVPGPSWQNQPPQPQQLSPLPKQLVPSTQRVMSPVSPTYAHTSSTPTFHQSGEPQFTDEQHTFEPAYSISQPEPTSSSSSQDQRSTSPSPSLSPAPPSSSPSSPSSASLSLNSFVVQWAVWSRRPKDPSHVPGLVFSSRTSLPTHIIQEALPDRTPPTSPTLDTSVLLPEVADESVNGSGVALEEISSSPTEPESSEVFTSSSSTAPSSSAVTEATETPSTTVPVSPATSSTSISAATKDGGGGVINKDTSPPQAQGSTVAESTEADSASASASAQVSQAQVHVPATTPASAPAPPAPAPLKKSWASLLRSPSSTPTSTSTLISGPSSSSSTSGPSSTTTLPPRAKIPISSVVGISIPAETNGSSAPSHSVPAAKRLELLRLLGSSFDSSSSVTGSASVTTTTTPGLSFSAAAAAASKPTAGVKHPHPHPHPHPQQFTPNDIRPRGLINTGNMCFANSVLQVLLYCPPFFRLFSELGKVGLGVRGNVSVNGNGNGIGGLGKELGVETPLVDATVEFLKDFLPRPSGESDETTTPTTTLKGKEKEKESSHSHSRPLTPSSREFDDSSSFIPTYIYDALKEQKRFDHMRGGHQEDAEEFLGFYLDTLEEELLGVVNALGGDGGDGIGEGGKGKGKRSEVEEIEEDAPPEEDGWLEVGKRNRTIITRTIKSTESPITRIFGGKFRSSLRVPGQKESAIVEDWRSLRLDIQRDQIHTVQEALSYISHPQQIHLTNPPREGSQLVQIEELPPVLILHMKRFEYDASVGGVVKIAKQIGFGSELVVGADVMAPTSASASASASAGTGMGMGSGKGSGGGGGRTTRYKLFAVIYHHGVSASGGHYTLDVLHPNRFPGSGACSGAGGKGEREREKLREGWIRIDDELVSDVRPEDVFDESGEYGHGDGTRCAYLLFYRRVR